MQVHVPRALNYQRYGMNLGRNRFLIHVKSYFVLGILFQHNQVTPDDIDVIAFKTQGLTSFGKHILDLVTLFTPYSP